MIRNKKFGKDVWKTKRCMNVSKLNIDMFTYMRREDSTLIRMFLLLDEICKYRNVNGFKGETCVECNL